MRQERISEASSRPLSVRKPSGLARRLWRRIRKPLAGSQIVQGALVRLLTTGFRIVYRTSRPVPGSDDTAAKLTEHMPAIVALWHGQHLLAPFDRPAHIPVVAMFSRSADAELNARVAERLGFGTARGSGGRSRRKSVDKGGARALLALKKALGEGTTVVMIADIPHGTPREAGMGVVTLARISGRPILPVAYATSRRKVLDRTWDKTTINLPFGRRAVVFGEPIHVSREAGEAEMEDSRRAVTASLDAVTARAYALVDAAP
jgi:lysophospholipid acyltransferase (LPLAT)-like uncharacterized protein